MDMFSYLFVCLFICLFVCLMSFFVRLSICLSIQLRGWEGRYYQGIVRSAIVKRQ